MRLKALAEIYTMHSFALLQNHIFNDFFNNLVEFNLNFAKICVRKFANFAEFCKFWKKNGIF